MSTALKIREIECNSIPVLACQDTDTEILVGIKSICDSLGLAYNGQMERIKRDELLIEGVRKIRVPSNGGEQETSMLIISFLPFFLTGIKSKMVKPELQNRIFEFKLKAKDILAQAFLPKQTQSIEPISDNSLTIIKNRISYLEQFVNNTIGTLSFMLKSFEIKLDAIENEMLQTDDEIYETAIDALNMASYNMDDLRELTYRFDHMNTPILDIESNEEIALRVSMSPDFRQWITKQVMKLAKRKRLWTGYIRQESYKILKDKGFQYLTGKCNLNKILFGNLDNIKYMYALTLIEMEN